MADSTQFQTPAPDMPIIGETKALKRPPTTRPSVFLHLVDGTDIRIMDNIPLSTIRDIGSRLTPLERSLWKTRLQWIGENL